MADPVLASYTVTLADFKAAQRLYWRRNRRARLRFWFWYGLMPAVGTGALVLYVYGLHHIKWFSPWIGGLLAMLAWIGIFPVLWRPIQVRLLYRQMKEGRNPAEPVELEIRDDLLISRRPGLSEGHFQPAGILSFVEDEHIALLFVRKKLFLPVPHRALDAAGWAELRQWLGDKVPSEKH